MYVNALLVTKFVIVSSSSFCYYDCGGHVVTKTNLLGKTACACRTHTPHAHTHRDKKQAVMAGMLLHMHTDI